MEDQSVVKKIGNCLITKTGIQFDGKVEFQEWEKRGKDITTVINLYNNNIAWWLGDWIIYGERNYKEKYSQALEGTMFTVGHLRNCVWVCRNVAQDVRNEALSFQHHYEVASLSKQEQIEWLAKADLNRWTAKQLRNAIKGLEKEEQYDVEDTREDIMQNAVFHSKAGMSFEEWWSIDGKYVSSERLQKKDLAYVAWTAAVMSRAKQAEAETRNG